MKKFISYLSTYVEDALDLSLVSNFIIGGVLLMVHVESSDLFLSGCLLAFAVCSFIVALVSGAALVGKIKDEEEEA